MFLEDELETPSKDFPVYFMFELWRQFVIQRNVRLFITKHYKYTEWWTHRHVLYNRLQQPQVNLTNTLTKHFVYASTR